MRIILVYIASILFYQSVCAQNTMGTGDNDLYVGSPNFALDYLKAGVTDNLHNPDMYAGVEGSPFLFDDWTYARIKLIDNKRYDSVLLKLNLFENKIHFKDKDGRERMIAIQAKEIEIKDESSKWNNTVFVSGYGTDKNVFFQVMADGKKVGYLKSMNIIKREYKVFNAPNEKKFETQQGKLYLFVKGVLYEPGKNCSSLTAAFGNDSKVNSFIAANDIKCNKEKDLKKLVDYYNSY